MQTIVLASGNKGKLREFQDLLQNCDFIVQAQSEWGVPNVEETGFTFVENAILKARQACQITGLSAIADDSGIEVDALRGAPGIYSARFAGEHATDEANNIKLLQLLEQTPLSARSARYQCVLVFMKHAQDPTPIICQASWEGVILTEARGDGGFGYDPLFFLPDQNCTAAELNKAHKNALSHRGKAMELLLEALTVNASRT